MLEFLRKNAALSSLLFLAWVPLLWRLALYWQSNAQYQYGWLVAPAVAYLLWQRWLGRPEPQAGRHALAGTLLVCSLILFAPLWLVLAANTDWRPFCWILALAVISLTLSLIELKGGRAWSLHFGWPLLLIATAIPWLSFVEGFVVKNLMFAVADVTVFLLDLLGVPARQVGILIEVRGGLLGVEEACSGVRSLQAALTAALLLGELYRLSTKRRLALVGVGLGAAIFFNIIRALLLTLAASGGGSAAVDRWHDPAGFSILTACLVLLWIVAARWQSEEPLELSGKLSPAFRLRPLGLWLGSLWLGLVLTGTELWYRSADHLAGEALHVRWPKTASGFGFDDIPEETAAEMGSDIGQSAHWTGREGHLWLMFYFYWPPGSDTSQLLARQHRPEVCLPAVGTTMTARRSPVTIRKNGESIVFRAYTFERYGQPLQVYYTRWEQRPLAGGTRSGGRSLQHDRLQSVWERRRRFGQQLVEVAIAGLSDAAAADALLADRLPELLYIKQPDPARL